MAEGEVEGDCGEVRGVCGRELESVYGGVYLEIEGEGVGCEGVGCEGWGG